MKRKSILSNPSVQTVLSSLFCILVGLLVGYAVLMIIEPSGATKAIVSIVKSWSNSKLPNIRIKNLAMTLINTAPLLMCSLSVLFAYKVGLFNIGVAGQYTIGVAACLYCGLYLKLNWFVCLIAAIAAGALLGVVSGALKSYLNVSEVISGIMLNWISLYVTNTLLYPVKETASPYTFKLKQFGTQALIPHGGVEKLFGNYEFVTIALPLAIIIAVAIWFILEKTTFGYELKATGLNKNAAKYAGMAENRNIVITLAISGALAGLGASFLYQTGIIQWSVTSTSLPGMGFNGIAAAFLGGLNPIGAILSSYFIQHIATGGGFIDLSLYPSQTADLITSIIIYLCGFTAFFRASINAYLVKKEENKSLKEGGKE